MKLRVSVAGILFPQARKSLAAMEETLRFLQGKADMLEFYRESGEDAAVGELLKETGLASIFVAVIPLKEKGLNLCGPDAENRKAAVLEMEDAVKRARNLGCEAVMLCSGKKPQGGHWASMACLDAFTRSLREIAAFVQETGPVMPLLLEPCDSGLDVKHLLGPTALSVEMVRRVREFYPAFSLTMDTAHVAEEGEDFLEAMDLARPYCSHVHFANCMLQNSADPLYGDKHPGFDYPGGSLPYAELARILQGLEARYADARLDIALEVLCRENDPYAHFLAIREQLPRLFEQREKSKAPSYAGGR